MPPIDRPPPRVPRGTRPTVWPRKPVLDLDQVEAFKIPASPLRGILHRLAVSYAVATALVCWVEAPPAVRDAVAVATMGAALLVALVGLSFLALLVNPPPPDPLPRFYMLPPGPPRGQERTGRLDRHRTTWRAR